MTQLNWPKLFSEGRCKAPDLPWNNDELDAINKLKIPVTYVRDGIVNLKDYEKALEEEAATGKVPLARMSREDLILKADTLGIKYSPDINTEILVSEIKKRQDLKERQAEGVKSNRKALDKAEKTEQEFQAKKRIEMDKEIEKQRKEGRVDNRTVSVPGEGLKSSIQKSDEDKKKEEKKAADKKKRDELKAKEKEADEAKAAKADKAKQDKVNKGKK